VLLHDYRSTVHDISHFLRVKVSDGVDVIQDLRRAKSELLPSCSRLDPIGEATWKRPGGGNLGGGPFITRGGKKEDGEGDFRGWRTR
jgi:hypothetical protein